MLLGLLVCGITWGANVASAESIEVPEVHFYEVAVFVLPELEKFGKPARPEVPIAIQTRAELEKIVTDTAVVEAIMKGVDFDKEWLAFCRWNGSGQDQLDVSVVKGEDGKLRVDVAYQPGRTEDLRQHAKLFVIQREHVAPPVADGKVTDDVAKVREGLATWAKLKEQCGGNYSYTIRFSSFAGFGHVTTIVVSANKVTERRFEKFDREPKPLAPGEVEPKKEGWSETGELLGSHEKEGAPVLTLDEIYASAEKIAAAELPKHERRYIRTDKQGLLTSCFTIDTRIADDAPTNGIVVNSITIEKP